MNESPIEARLAELNAKIDAMFFGFKACAFGVMALVSFYNVKLAWVIGYFQRIFADAMPGKPLPGLTLFLVEYQNLMMVLAVLWPLLGLIALAVDKKVTRLVVIVVVLVFIMTLQLTLTWQGLFAPFSELVTGMADTPPAK